MTTKIPAATLYALVRAYVEARNTNSHIVLFASTKALPDPVKEIIKTFVQRYYMEGLRFSHDGKELTPNDITVDGGSLLATYIHSLGSYTVMLASMCHHILKDDYLKKDFVAELPPGVELLERAWWDQKSVIKNVVSNYIADHIICPLHEDRENLIDQTRILGDLNQDLTKKLNEIDVQNGELRRDIEALGRENTYLQQCITSLEEAVAELEEEKENAPFTSKVLELLKQEEDVNVSMSEAGATVQVKSQKTPAKPKKTPRRAQFARTPAPVSNLYPSTPAPATSPREDID
jgi:regulator of replication initiation timing